MAIAPRCATTKAASAQSASITLTGWTNSSQGVSGTAPAAGDLVIVVASVAFAGITTVQTAGTGTWTFQAAGTNNGGTVAMSTFVAWRIFDGTETAPTFNWSHTARYGLTVIAITPDSGDVISIDNWATAIIDSVAATTHTAHAATDSGGTSELSLILSGAVTGASGTSAVTFSGPTGWTIPTGATVSNTGTVSTSGYGSTVAFEESVTGTVTPGAQTIEGGSSGTGTTQANLYHVLIQESSSLVTSTGSVALAPMALSGSDGSIHPLGGPALAPMAMSGSVTVELPYIAGLGGSGLNGYFVDQFGQPRVNWLEQGWALPWNAGRWNSGNWQSDFDTYFSVRASQGHTAWYGIPWGNTHVDSTANSGGQTWDNIFALNVNGTPGAIVTGTETITLNNSFWTRIDYMFNSAKTQGISCFLNLGMSYDFTDVGGVWANLSTTQATAFGAALAARYPQSSYPNVFWFFGDDSDGPQDTYFTHMLSGITGAGDTRGVISMEQFTDTNCHIEFDTLTAFGGGFGAASATYNWVYSYDPPYIGCEASYTETSGFTKIPPIYGDGVYYGDNSGSKDYTQRRFTWWALASGARGINNTSGPSTLGGGGVWTWQSGAVAALTSDPNGTWITTKAPAIISYFTGLADWHKLIPDTGNVFITAGRGTKTTSKAPGGSFNFGSTDNYVAGSITPAGTLAVIYGALGMSITVDQTKMAAGYTATWVDPASGATHAGTPGSTFSSAFLGNNSGGNADWVLVLQAEVATGGVALAPMAMSGTATGVAGVTSTGSVAGAPMAMSGTGTVTTVTATTGSLALAPMAESGSATGTPPGPAIGGLAMAPMGMSGSSVSINSTGSLAFAGMGFTGLISQPIDVIGFLALAPMALRSPAGGAIAPLDQNAGGSVSSSDSFGGSIS